MKKLKLFSLLMLLTLSIGQAWGTTVTYAQSSTSAAAVSSGTAPAGSSVTFANTYTNNKEQITGGNTMTLTLSGYDGYEITGVSVSVHNNKSSGAGSGSLTINGESKGSLSSITGLGNTSWTVKDFTVTTTTVATNGKVVIVLSCSTNSVFCNAFTITYGTPAAVATPTLSKATGTYLGTQNVTVSNYDGDFIYFYTTDGTTPAADANLDPTGTSQTYNNSTGIAISSSCTLKVIAYNLSSETSNVASATYTIENLEHAGTALDPYSVADARIAIDYGTSDQQNGKYAKGTVSAIVTALSSGKITYDLSTDGTTASDQLRAYGGKGIGGANFTSTDDIRVGDEVIVTGNLTKYGQVYEFATDNQLVSYVARTPKFTIANVPYLSTEAEDLAVEDLTVTKEGAGTITLVSGNNEIATIVENKIHPVAAGTVTITANLAANGYWRAKSTTFDVTVAVPCHNFVTLSIGTSATEGCSFTADQEAGEYPTCDDDFVVVVTPTAKTRWHVAEVLAPNSSSITGPVDGNYTVTYAQNTNAASQINVTFAEDTKYEVKWYANDALIATENYYYDQEIAAHAAPAALASIYVDKMFVGWVETPIVGEAADQPALANFPMDAAAKTFYALYATATKTADATLTKMVKNDNFAAGDKIVIVAKDTEFGLYHENASSSNWVKNWTFEGEDPVVADLSDEKKSLDVSAGSTSGKWKLGNATDGYLSNSSSTNLTFNETGSNWTLADLGNGTFTLTATQKLSCRTDLTSGNANLWRGGDNNGTNTLYLYKFVPAVYAYSAYVTTVPAHTYTLAWSLGAGANEELGEMEIVLDLEDKPTDSFKKYFDKEILTVGTYDVKLFEDGVETAITTTLEINAVAKYALQFDYDSAKGELTASASNPRTPTSVDNTEISNKAVKFIQNGQLFIELNGHIYNVQGQVVK